MSNAAVNIMYKYLSPLFSVLWDTYLGVESLGHEVILYSTFWEAIQSDPFYKAPLAGVSAGVFHSCPPHHTHTWGYLFFFRCLFRTPTCTTPSPPSSPQDGSLAPTHILSPPVPGTWGFSPFPWGAKPWAGQGLGRPPSHCPCNSGWISLGWQNQPLLWMRKLRLGWGAWDLYFTTPGPSYSWFFSISAALYIVLGEWLAHGPCMTNAFLVEFEEEKNLKERQALMDKYLKYSGVNGVSPKRYTHILTSHICGCKILGNRIFADVIKKDLEIRSSWA